MEMSNVTVIKKDGTHENFRPEKIIAAVGKSASRIMVNFTDEENQRIVDHVKADIERMNLTEIPIATMHSLVEAALRDVNEKVCKSYCDYRNYKKEFVHMMDDVYVKSQSIRYIGDKDNANTDSALVATKRSLIFNELNKQLYHKFFMTRDELQASKEGYIYVHDQSARLDTINCCLFDVKSVINGGFEMGNIWYNEPKTLDTAFDVLGDVVLSTAAQQYGGFTVPEVDTFLEPYAVKSYEKYKAEYLQDALDVKGDVEDGMFHLTDTANDAFLAKAQKRAEAYAEKKVHRDFEQGFQGIEYKLNTVGSSRGDYPFVTFSFGLGTGHFAKMANKTMLAVHQEGQGKEGFKRPVLFPKYVFLYDENLHGPGKECEDVFEAAIQCSARTMYPDYLSLTGEGYVASMYKKYGTAISPMGCVDGKEVITYKFHDKLYVESFERMWDRITAELPDVGQSFAEDENRMVDLSASDVTVWDTKVNGFVKVTHLIRNVQDQWCDVTLQFGRVLRVTADHPFETENRGVVSAKDLTAEDVIRIEQGQYTEDVIDVSPEDARKAGKSLEKGAPIPNEVFSYAENARINYLAGRIEADGIVDTCTVYTEEAGPTEVPVAFIRTDNKELALQQMLLAQSLDMQAEIYAMSPQNDSESVSYWARFELTREMYDAVEDICPVDFLYGEDDDITVDIKIADTAEVEKVSPFTLRQYSYDVTTESGHFEVSGVYSHNCRAFLSPWYERGGMEPADENDKPIFIGRCNLGVVSLNLPMILAKSRRESRDFYEVLDYYLEMSRNLHKRTYDYIGELRASVNPTMFCEGGIYGGHLDPKEKIRKLLPPMTMSFGITALNEMQRLYNGKSLAEDNQFSLEVMEHINAKAQEYKKEDGILYALYGSPAESLCYLQVQQFRKEFGIIPNVSDREYVSNSFHCHVTEKLTPIEKQDREYAFWNLFNGGKIQYVRYPLNYNIDSIRTLVRRAMKMGYYEGVNMSLAYCDDCGHEELDMDVCPVCGSRNLTKIDRMNGYLAYSRKHGSSRLNDGKMAEIKERVSM